MEWQGYVVETSVLRSIQQVLQSQPQPERQSEALGKDRVILERVPARERRVKGPEEAMPQGRWPDFEELIRPFGIIELQRTGRVALPRLERATTRLRSVTGKVS